MELQRSEVKSVYAEAEHRSIRRERAADSDGSFVLANWSSSVMNVSHPMVGSVPPADWIQRQSCSGNPARPLSRVILCDLPFVSQVLTLLSDHLEGPLEVRSEREITRHEAFSARNGNRRDAVIAGVLSPSLSPREGAVMLCSTLSVPMACDWSLAAPSAVSHSQKYAWSSAA